jgi:hypothetical protein
MPRPHTVTDDDLRQWLARDEWSIFASSSREPKRLETSHLGRLRVTHGAEVVYVGQDVSDAVRAYNEIDIEAGLEQPHRELTIKTE